MNGCGEAFCLQNKVSKKKDVECEMLLPKSLESYHTPSRVWLSTSNQERAPTRRGGERNYNHEEGDPSKRWSKM